MHVCRARHSQASRQCYGEPAALCTATGARQATLSRQGSRLECRRACRQKVEMVAWGQRTQGAFRVHTVAWLEFGKRVLARDAHAGWIDRATRNEVSRLKQILRVCARAIKHVKPMGPAAARHSSAAAGGWRHGTGCRRLGRRPHLRLGPLRRAAPAQLAGGDCRHARGCAQTRLRCSLPRLSAP
jgi:hypothetical protein